MDFRVNIRIRPSQRAGSGIVAPGNIGTVGEDVIFNVKEAAGVSLWRKRIGSDREQALEGMPTLSYTDSWAAAAAGIYFTLASDDAREVRFYDLATQQIRPVARLAQAPAPAGGLALSVSSDNRWLLYTQSEDEQGDIMVLTLP